jgi:plastocyanin domain-containing protein
LNDQFVKDQMGGYAFNAGYNLMMGLMKMQEKNRKAS